MKVRGYTHKQVAVDGVRTRPYPHQAAMLNEWSKHDAFLLVTKTGSGKTRATALPVLKNHESAVFVYPTNALIKDQARAIQQLMIDEAISFREWTPQNANEKFGAEEYVLVQVNAPVLEEFAREWGMGGKQKGVALLRLLYHGRLRFLSRGSLRQRYFPFAEDFSFLAFGLLFRGRLCSRAILGFFFPSARAGHDAKQEDQQQGAPPSHTFFYQIGGDSSKGRSW